MCSTDSRFTPSSHRTNHKRCKSMKQMAVSDFTCALYSVTSHKHILLLASVCSKVAARHYLLDESCVATWMVSNVHITIMKGIITWKNKGHFKEKISLTSPEKCY